MRWTVYFGVGWLLFSRWVFRGRLGFCGSSGLGGGKVGFVLGLGSCLFCMWLRGFGFAVILGVGWGFCIFVW